MATSATVAAGRSLLIGVRRCRRLRVVEKERTTTARSTCSKGSNKQITRLSHEPACSSVSDGRYYTSCRSHVAAITTNTCGTSSIREVHVHLDAQSQRNRTPSSSTRNSSWTSVVAGKPPHLLNSGTGGLQLGLVGPAGSHACIQPLVMTQIHAGATLPGQCHCYSSPRARQMSTWTDVLPCVPEFAQQWTVWGGSGIILKTIHHDGAVPYWACMAITNILVRSSLIPLVIQSAQTSSRFAKVAPEVQFLLTIFQKDMKGLRERNESPVTQFLVMRATWQTLSALYKVHKIHPFAVFRSPLMQLPVFWYFSIDLRKIINGADPGLAQGLTEGGLFWVTDLTEPDPWYGLPILGGLLLYANVEVALGKKILSGEATSKASVAVTLKDFFQSLAVFMPCFMAHQPAGVQIYLATSFVFTMFQSAALRNDSIRAIVGLPKKDAQPKEGVVTKEFVGIKEFEQKAREARGEGELLGEHGVLQPGWEITVPGTSRPSTIAGSADGNRRTLESLKARDGPSTSDPASLRKLWSPSLEVLDDSIAVASVAKSTPAGSGVLMKEGSSLTDSNVKALPQKSGHKADDEEYMHVVDEADIEAANRGELPQKPITFANPDDRSDKNSNLRLSNITKKKRKRKGRKKK